MFHLGGKGLRQLLPYFFFLLFITSSYFGQENLSDVKVSVDSKVLDYDTTYYYQYSDRLIFSIYQSPRSYEIGLNSTLPNSKDVLYRAEAKVVTGIEIIYDKFSVSFGIKSRPPEGESIKGKTQHFNFGFSAGGNKYLLEANYRRWKGFYDQNTSSYDSTYESGEPLLQNPSLTNHLLKLKFFGFKNFHRYSYKSSYSNNYRQIRSAGSFIYTGNVYLNRFNSDTSFMPGNIQASVGSFLDWNGITVGSLSAGGGWSGNLVLFRSFYFNILLALNVEAQYIKYEFIQKSNVVVLKPGFSSDSRLSFGYNGRNFFIRVSGLFDTMNFNRKEMKVSSKTINGNFSIGYRFKVNTPQIYKDFQKTSLYNKF